MWVTEFMFCMEILEVRVLILKIFCYDSHIQVSSPVIQGAVSNSALNDGKDGKCRADQVKKTITRFKIIVIVINLFDRLLLKQKQS